MGGEPHPSKVRRDDGADIVAEHLHLRYLSDNWVGGGSKKTEQAVGVRHYREQDRSEVVDRRSAVPWTVRSFESDMSFGSA